MAWEQMALLYSDFWFMASILRDGGFSDPSTLNLTAICYVRARLGICFGWF